MKNYEMEMVMKFFFSDVTREYKKDGKKYLNNMRIKEKSIENEGKKAISQHPVYYIIFPFSQSLYIFSFLQKNFRGLFSNITPRRLQEDEKQNIKYVVRP